MSWFLERRLSRTARRLRALRDELREIDEQIVHLSDEADDTALRAIVSETPGVSREAIDARRHADAHARHRTRVVAAIASLEAQQDALLDRLTAGR